MAVRKGLGKGLDSLISAVPAQAHANQNKAAKKTADVAAKTEKNVVSKKETSKKETEKKKTTDKESKSATTTNTENITNIEESTNIDMNNINNISKNIDVMVKISSVEPNREQPRKVFEEDSLIELADSIKQFGVLQPLLVQKRDDYYEIIAGERRWRAAKLAGLKEIPVLIRDFSDQEIVEIALIENIQREDLNPIEEAMAYKRLLDEFNLKQDEIAERVSKSRTTITNSMRLLKLDERVKQMVVDDMITTGHARALLSIEDKETQYKLAMKIFDNNLNVRDTEKLVKSIVNPKNKKESNPIISQATAAIYENLEDRMKTILGTKVLINPKTKHKGKIEIEYYSDNELERILDLIQSIQA